MSSYDQTALGHYGSSEVELFGGPFDGATHQLSNHPMANSRFYLRLDNSERAWYQYHGYWYGDGTPKQMAYYVGTTH